MPSPPSKDKKKDIVKSPPKSATKEAKDAKKDKSGAK
jgi:hypothetical protein